MSKEIAAALLAADAAVASAAVAAPEPRRWRLVNGECVMAVLMRDRLQPLM
jgi:hypothetical protein